jgi:hypothetical protein
MDVSGPFPSTIGYSDMAWNVFTPNEDKVYEITKKKMKIFRCDNAGGNGKIRNLCNKFGVTMDYTTPCTPQKMA